MVEDIIKQVKDFYDEAGVHFSRTRQKTYGNGQSSNWRVTDKYLSLLAPGCSVLDIGCGNGKLVSGLPKGVAYVGTDFSITLLNEAKRLYPKHDFRLGDVTKKEHWDNLGEYDAIFAVAVLHHIPTRELQLWVLKQAKKHLKKNGFFFLTVWNLWQERFLQYHLDGYASVPFQNKWDRYCVTFDLAGLSELFTIAGMKVTEIFYADTAGEKANIQTGQNLVVVAR